MSNHDILNQQLESITDFFILDEEKIQLLQKILESELGQPITFEYAEEVGIQLITLYECLARDKIIIIRGGNE